MSQEETLEALFACAEKWCSFSSELALDAALAPAGARDDP
jgi:hypothetical protein